MWGTCWRPLLGAGDIHLSLLYLLSPLITVQNHGIVVNGLLITCCRIFIFILSFWTETLWCGGHFLFRTYYIEGDVCIISVRWKVFQLRRNYIGPFLSGPEHFPAFGCCSVGCRWSSETAGKSPNQKLSSPARVSVACRWSRRAWLLLCTSWAEVPQGEQYHSACRVCVTEPLSCDKGRISLHQDFSFYALRLLLSSYRGLVAVKS